MQSHLLHSFGFNRIYVHMLMKDVPDPRLAEQPEGIRNHGAWNLGHILYSLDFARQLAGIDPDPNPVPSELFSMGSTPSDDRSLYPSKQQLLDKLDAAHETMTPAIASMGASAQNVANPSEEFRQVMPTVGDALAFLTTSHYGLHLGELAVWRKAIGFSQVI